MKIVFAIAAAAFLGLASPGRADAQVINWAFSWTGNSTGSGTITTTGGPDVNGFYTITGITGTYEGNSITGLEAPGNFGTNDNLIRATGPQLTTGGFAFDHTGGSTRIFYSSPDYFDLFTYTISFTATPAAAVPEPSALVLSTGIGAAFGLARMARRLRPGRSKRRHAA